jgi:pyruvate/2-oxoglutarate dehydrogenase complex dihydrolipoamide dehydrogenase (E3) component
MANVATVPELETVPVLTNANVIDLDILPDRLLGLGGSYIGLSLHIFCAARGSDDHSSSPLEFLGREDATIIAQVQKVLTDGRIRIEVGTTHLFFLP